MILDALTALLSVLGGITFAAVLALFAFAPYVDH